MNTMKLILLRCSSSDFESSRILALPADWTAIPLNKALQIAFGREGDISFVFRDAAYRECVFDINENRSESGLSFATPLSGLFPKDGWRLLWLEGEDERSVILQRIGEEDGDAPACREASGPGDEAPVLSEKLRRIPFDPKTDGRPGAENPLGFKTMDVLPEECDPDETLDVEPVDEAALATALAIVPPPPARLPDLLRRAESGDRAAMVEWADRFVQSFPRDLAEGPDVYPILRGISLSIRDGDLRAKTIAGRWLLEHPSLPPAALFRGWTLLREAANAGFGKAWDALGRTCMDLCRLNAFRDRLEPFDPDHRTIPEPNDIPAFALHCFRRATECGCAVGWNGLSWAAEEGVGTPNGERDDALAEENERHGAEAGDSHSCFNLAYRLVNRPEHDRDKRLRFRREALSLFVRGMMGTDILEDDFQDATTIIDHWTDFGKVAPESLSALLFHEGVERYYHNTAEQDDEDEPENDGAPGKEIDESVEDAKWRRKKNIELMDSWIEWMSHSDGATATPELARGIALLNDPDATPKQLREGFQLVKAATDSSSDPAAWDQLARCYENGIGIYRNKNRAARCRKVAETRRKLFENSEKLFTFTCPFVKLRHDAQTPNLSAPTTPTTP